jgi:hypothetical protein
MLPNAWIFNGNPKKYFFQKALAAANSRLRWSVRQEVYDIDKGDKVYLWQGGPEPGIVAVGIVVSKPTDLGEPPHEQQYWRKGQPEGFEGVRLRARIIITHRLSSVLRKDELSEDEVLRKLKIVKMTSARETNYRVSGPQMMRLDKMIASFDG